MGPAAVNSSQPEKRLPRPSIRLAQILGTAGAYCAMGELAALLPHPQVYAAIIWPAAGMALAATLIFGCRIWPGIFLGTLIVNLRLSLDLSSTTMALITVATSAAISTGATLQALAGAWLVRRSVSGKLHLEEPSHIGKLLLLGGPVACLLNGLSGPGCLTFLGTIPASEYVSNAFTWWLGDTIGVILITPPVVLFAEPRVAWRRRFVPAALTTAASAMICLLVFVYASGVEGARIQHEFDEDSQGLAARLRRNLDSQIDSVYSVANYFRSSEKVESREFRAFVEPTLERMPALEALAWVRRIPVHKADATAESPDSPHQTDAPDRQTAPAPDSSLPIPAELRDAEFIVEYVEPKELAWALLGTNVGLNPQYHEALVRTRKTAEAVVTGPSLSVPVPGRGPAILVFVSVYEDQKIPVTLHERYHRLQGYAMGIFRVHDVIQSSLEAMTLDDVVIRLVDAGSPDGQMLFQNRANIGSRDGMSWSTSFAIAGRPWKLHLTATSTYLDRHSVWRPWTVLVTGLLFYALLTVLMLSITGRTAKTEELVAERTDALRRSNVSLAETSSALRQKLDELARANAEIQQLAAIVEASDDAILRKSLDGQILTWNAGAEHLFGYTAEEVIGHHTSMLFPPGHEEEIATMMAAVRAGDHVTQVETRRQHKQGRILHVSVSISPIRDSTGVVRSACAIIHDIGPLKQAERALRKHVDDLARSNEELDSFAYVASHDLKEPLRGIHNYATFVKEDYSDQLDEEGKSKLETLVRLSKRMENLIEALLQYSRVGKVDMAIQETDLDQVLDEVVDSLQISLEEAGVEVRKGSSLPTLRCDGARIGEVFQNLVTNAMKYNDKTEKWIEVGCMAAPVGTQSTASLDSTSCRGDEWLFYVRDNGIGIRDKHLERIFRIFKRLHGRDRFGGGTGAGLTIAKKIVERHGGRIWAESIYGEGSTFCFTLKEIG